MHQRLEVGANVSNPHLTATYIMLNSIYFKLTFFNVRDARQCLRNVSGKSYYEITRAYTEKLGSLHVVIVKASRTWPFGFDGEDINLLTDGCKPNSFIWSFDVFSEVEVEYYICMHKS